jgi:arginyl-tRNA synthetase
MNLFSAFRDVIAAKLEEMAADGALPQGLDHSRIVVEAPRDPSHGDVTTNAAMVLAKPAGQKPRDLAAALGEKLAALDDVEAAEVAGPGFVNLG